ncbi:MAG: CRISPR-associated endonuclease Cas1 [Acidobacteriota bacterium]
MVREQMDGGEGAKREGEILFRSPAQDLIPARILNEYVYCPRLAYLEWVQAEFEDSADTIEGRHQHRRVDAGGPLLPEPEEGEAESIHARSVMLSADDPGIIARMDLVEAEGANATPVDYKHGRKPDRPEGAWDTDLVQIAAQAVVLRANGYQCDRGVIYYIASKTRVDVEIDSGLIEKVRDVCRDLREMARARVIPAPLRDSPKCPGCSLAGICLPDETRFLAPGTREEEEEEPRRLYPILPDALPMYVQEQGAVVGKRDEALVVKVRGQEVAEVPLLQISHLALFGNVQTTTQALRELCSRGQAVCYFSSGGYFYGITHDIGSRNVDLRRAQFRKADDPAVCLALGRRIAWAKVRNQRTLLRRNSTSVSDQDLRDLDRLADAARAAETPETLLGCEGAAARIYFGNFGSMLKTGDETSVVFHFDGRNRRPPRDPVNALLSLCYALLAKDCTVTLLAVGFDPYLGFYHTAHHGRPSLALDLMEEFRPLIADSVVITVINNGEVGPGDFVRAGGAVSLKPAARKTLIQAYERRMDQAISHPVFGYKASYRKTLEVQSRLLARYLSGEISEWPAILPR